MTDLSEKTLTQLRSHSLPNLSLSPEFILPDYDGGSIANLPSQIALWLGAPPFGLAPLHSQLAQPLGTDIRQVILVLMDAFGFQRFRSILTESGSAWQRLAAAGLLAPLTSVFPSTTTAALTSLATGRAPGEHNMLGYELWLKEYGAVSNMITFSPMSAAQQPERLSEGGFDPEHFLTVPIWAQHLAAHSVTARAFMPAHISGSGLSRMHLAGLQTYPFFAPADLCFNLRQLLEASTRTRQFIWVYWEVIDTLSHVYGPSAEAVEWEARQFGETLARICLDRLSPAARAGTVILIAADHGQVDTPPIPDFDLKQHPDFTERLHILPSGENRAAYLHCRPGEVGAVRMFIEQRWPDHFQVLPQQEVMASGLLGDQLDPRTASRLGELLVLSKGQAYLWWANKENKLRGRHGGLTADEMLVPLLAARLDQWAQ
jgi:hypothetical protein